MPPDYRALIDAETWTFIDRLNSFYPPEAVDWPIARNREVYDRMCRVFHAGRPAGVTAAEIEQAGGPLPARLYRAASPDPSAMLLYFHGGGFILGGLESHDDICADLCAGTGFAVLSIDYRLAPEHTGTAAFDDALASFDWAADAFDQPIVLVGESAGGNLAAAVAHATRDRPRPVVGQLLVYPSLGACLDTRSGRLHAEAPLLSARDLDFYRDVRGGGPAACADPRYTPLSDGSFGGLPRTVIVTAECDPLSSEGEIYRDRIHAAGGDAGWFEEKGLPHGFLRARAVSTRAGAAFTRIVGVARALGRREPLPCI